MSRETKCTFFFFSKENMQMANRYTEICSISLIIWEIEIKTTRRYYLTFVRMAIMKETRDIKHQRGCGEKEILYTVSGTIIWFTHYGKQYGDSSKKLKIEPPYDPTVPGSAIWSNGPRYIPKGNEKRTSKRYMHSHVYCSINRKNPCPFKG